MIYFSTFIVKRLQQGTINAKFHYLLMDTSVVENAATAIPILKSFPSMDILSEGKVEWKETASPVLIQLPEQPLRSLQGQQWLAFFEKWRWANAFIYVVSSHPFKSLSKALAKRINVQLSDEDDMLLRYFDTRIFASLLNVLEPAQQTSFLEIAEAWHYPNRDGILVSLSKTENNTSLQKQDTFQTELGPI